MLACENKKVLSWSFGWFVGHFGGVLDVVAVLVVLVILSIVRLVVLLLGRFGRFVVSVVLVVLVVWFWSFGLLLFVLLLCGLFVCYVCWTLLDPFKRVSLFAVRHLHRVALHSMYLVYEFVTRWCNLSISLESNAECQTFDVVWNLNIYGLEKSAIIEIHSNEIYKRTKNQ